MNVDDLLSIHYQQKCLWTCSIADYWLCTLGLIYDSCKEGQTNISIQFGNWKPKSNPCLLMTLKNYNAKCVVRILITFVTGKRN